MVLRRRDSVWHSTVSVASVPWTNLTIQSLSPDVRVLIQGVSVIRGFAIIEVWLIVVTAAGAVTNAQHRYGHDTLC